MKVNEIFSLARSFLGEKTSGYGNAAFVPGWLNLLLIECLPYENALRASQGKELLTEAPQITSMDDEIDYCPQITQTALPYGLAFFFYNEDEEKYQAQLMHNAYIAGLKSAIKIQETDITDCYGGDIDG